MNASSIRPRAAAGASIGGRAQFSPVLSAARQHMLARNRRALLAVTRSPVLGSGARAVNAGPAFHNTAAPAPIRPWWNPRLLDQLSEPLSRIRE